MNTDFSSSFLLATRNVFQLMLNISDVQDYPDGVFDHENTIDISIGVIGDLVGEVVYRFPYETSIEMVKAMSGMEVDSVDTFVTSAISEMANIISGNVLTLLSEEEIHCDILPPKEVASDEEKAYSVQTSCCIDTSVGDVCMNIHLNPAK